MSKSTTSPKTEVIMVDEDVVTDIQLKDNERQVLNDVYSNLINQHIGDTNDSFMDAPVVTRARKDAAKASVAWERAKNDMVQKFIPADKQKIVRNWNLDYATCELTLTF